MSLRTFLAVKLALKIIPHHNTQNRKLPYLTPRTHRKHQINQDNPELYIYHKSPHPHGQRKSLKNTTIFTQNYTKPETTTSLSGRKIK
jgi:hypothetical protein